MATVTWNFDSLDAFNILSNFLLTCVGQKVFFGWIELVNWAIVNNSLLSLLGRFGSHKGIIWHNNAKITHENYLVYL